MVRGWSPDGWRNKPVQQVPEYPDAAKLVAAEAKLRTYPSLVIAPEARRLEAHLAEVAHGRAFLLQGGDCAESFAEFCAEDVQGTFRTLLQMALVLTYGKARPVVKVLRVAGQFAKPRSALREVMNGVELSSYRGDIINGPEFTAEARAPDPDRMLRAYMQSAAKLNLLRALARSGDTDPRALHRRNLDFALSCPQNKRHLDLACHLEEALTFMAACGMTGEAAPAARDDDVFTSHEALLLPYEEVLTRLDPATGRWYDGSAHMLWIGDRTRQVDGAHVEFLRGVANPLGFKAGPSSTPDDVLALIDRLNPTNEPGRITIITRMGKDQVEAKLTPLVRAVRREGRVVTWACDPMHGNTMQLGAYKTRSFDAILAELMQFFAIHRAEGTHAGGVHLEMTGKAVTECIGGARAVTAEGLGERYETACDPRLNGDQALELAFMIAEAFEEERRRARLKEQASPRERERAETAASRTRAPGWALEIGLGRGAPGRSRASSSQPRKSSQKRAAERFQQ